jgi:hypothetical protein
MRKKHYTPPPTLFSNDKVLESIIRLLVFLARALKSATFFSGGEGGEVLEMARLSNAVIGCLVGPTFRCQEPPILT